MNIPDEVLHAADVAADGRVQDSRSARVIAEWARKEALREAAKLAAQARTNVEAMQAIRALAEGETR